MVQAQREESQTRKHAAVILAKNNRNVGVALVREGLAEVVRHRADEDRSVYYDVKINK